MQNGSCVEVGMHASAIFARYSKFIEGDRWDWIARLGGVS